MEFNAFSWNKNASVLYLESPPGVGFSITSTYNFNDTSTALANYLALQVFFAGYPEFLTNEFYIAGESYGGVYVPTLASAIIDFNSNTP